MRSDQQLRAMCIVTDLQALPVSDKMPQSACANFTTVGRVSSTLTLRILESDHLIQAASTKFNCVSEISVEAMKTGCIIQGRFLHGQRLTKIDCNNGLLPLEAPTFDTNLSLLISIYYLIVFVGTICKKIKAISLSLVIITPIILFHSHNVF